jgi:hypothetical protein
MKEKFLAFLKKHKCLTAYKKYILWNFGSQKKVNKFFDRNNNNPQLWLSMAFPWGRANKDKTYSAECTQYWRNIDIEWQHDLREE